MTRPTIRNLANRRRDSRRRGGAVIETALVLPVVLMLTFGAVEYGYAFYLKHALAGAAYVGARAAITTGSTDASLRTAVSASMTAAGFQSSQYAVTTLPTTVTGVAPGTYVTVTITSTWGSIGITPLPVAMGGLPASKQLTCSVLMAHE